VPVRQWVLSLPWKLRALAAFKADVLSALARIFVEAIFARHQSWAKSRGLGPAPSGAVTHVQRFGSSINLNVHFHVMVLDGVFTRDELGRPVFHRASSPTRLELERLVRRVHGQAVAWLARKGYLDASPGSRSQDTPAQTSLDACAAIAMGCGMVRALRDDPDAERRGEPDVQAPPGDDRAVEHDGFNVHASVAVAGDDDLGRERLMRYGARPQLALDRLRRLPGGRIAYRIKKLRDGRAKHRVMTPLEFLARLAAIVPPPRYPLLRYHGVLGPRSSWRRDVVPKPPEAKRFAPQPAKPKKDPAPRSNGACKSLPTAASQQPPTARATCEPAPGAKSVATSTTALDLVRSAGAPTNAKAVLLAPNILSTKHWSRLLGGSLYAASPRVDWATLLRRSFEVDVLRCAACGGRLRVLGEVTEPSLVALVLESLSLPPDAPRVAPARDPTELLAAETD